MMEVKREKEGRPWYSIKNACCYDFADIFKDDWAIYDDVRQRFEVDIDSDDICDIQTKTLRYCPFCGTYIQVRNVDKKLTDY